MIDGSGTAGGMRIVVADDDPLVRGALRDALAASPEISIEAEVTTGREAVDAAMRLRPDVVLIKADLPDGDGISSTTLIRRRAPDVQVVILVNTEDVELGLLGLRAGASGFLQKDLPPEAFARAVRGVGDGEAAISRLLTRKLVDRMRLAPDRGAGMRPVISTLTTREWQVLDLLCDGLTTRAIATSLTLSHDTVRTHVKHVLAKLRAHSREEAVAAAARMRSGAGAEQHSLDELALRRGARGPRR